MKNFLTHLFLLPALGLTFTSCGQNAAEKPVTPQKPLLTQGATPANLSLKAACALAVTHHPSLATYSMDRRAADARLILETAAKHEVPVEMLWKPGSLTSGAGRESGPATKP